MANRRFRSQFLYHHEVMVVDLFAQIDIGASGAPTLNIPNSTTIIRSMYIAYAPYAKRPICITFPVSTPPHYTLICSQMPSHPLPSALTQSGEESIITAEAYCE